MVEAEPNADIAFDILLDTCNFAGLKDELLIGLGITMMAMSRHVHRPVFCAPIMIPKSPRRSKPMDLGDRRLFHALDKCMSLSLTQDALDSLLCGAFCNPSIPVTYLVHRRWAFGTRCS